MTPSTAAAAAASGDARPPAVRGVTFDLDDTLWCGRAVIQRASASFHAFVEARAPAAAARFPPGAFYSEMARFQRELPDRAHDYTFLRKHTLRFCLDAAAADGEGEEAQHLRALVGDEARVEALVEDAFQAFLLPRSRPEFFDGALELLDALETELEASNGRGDPAAPASSVTTDETAAATLLGAVTNGNCVLEELPLAFRRRVRFVVSAESVGCAKPRPEIFDAAVERFPPGVRRDQIVHVGDHYACDVEGAKRAGMRTIWVNAAWRGPDVMRARPGTALEPVDPSVDGQEQADGSDAAEDDRPASERFPEADAIVRQVGAVLAVVARWNRESREE